MARFAGRNVLRARQLLPTPQGGLRFSELGLLHGHVGLALPVIESEENVACADFVAHRHRNLDDGARYDRGDLNVLRARLDQPVDSLPPFPGLAEHEREGAQVSWEYSGALPPLLEWLSRLPVADLRIQPMGLAPIYHRYHGAQP